jgi:hypothetical protein
MMVRATMVLGLAAGLTAAFAARAGYDDPPGAEAKAKPKAESKAEGLSASEILKPVADVYAGCKTYQDSGVVATEIKDSGGDRSRRVERPFATAFVRPDRFRLESREVRTEGDATPRAIVWWKGEEIKTWARKRTASKETPRTYAEAFGEPRGVAVGSAYTVPALLLTGQNIGRRLSDLTGVQRLNDDKAGKADCYCVKGSYGDVETTVWVEKVSFLIRRVDRRFQAETFSSDETTTYEPVVDAEVPPARLEFSPPAGATGTP